MLLVSWILSNCTYSLNQNMLTLDLNSCFYKISSIQRLEV